MEYYKTYTIEQIEEMANGAARQSEPAIMLRQLLAERKELLAANRIANTYVITLREDIEELVRDNK